MRQGVFFPLVSIAALVISLTIWVSLTDTSVVVVPTSERKVTIQGKYIFVTPPPTTTTLSSSSTTTTTIQQSNDEEKTRVFGVGLSETGTSAMAEAFVMMGYKRTIHTDSSVAHFMHHANETANLIGRYDNVESLWDVPTAGYYKELWRAYPDSKFVLTTRSSEAWFESIERAMYNTKWGCNIPIRIRRLNTFLYGSPLPDHDIWIKAYEKHNEEVKSFFAKQGYPFLVVNVYENDNPWDEICTYVGIIDGPCADNRRRKRSFFGQRNVGEPFQSLRDSTNIDANDNDDEDMMVEKCITGDADGTTTTAVPLRKPNHAYAMLVCNPANEDQVGYFRMLLTLKESINKYNNYADVVVLVYGLLRDDQRKLLEFEGFIVKEVDTVGVAVSHPVTEVSDEASACYRAKNRVLELVEYDKIVFLDTDMVLKRDQDDMFNQTTGFYAYDGPGAPFCAGQFALSPSKQAFADVSDLMETDAFTPTNGWLDYGKIPYWKDTNRMTDWSFYGSAWDQGPLYYYYVFLLQDAIMLSSKGANKGIRHYGGHDAKPYLFNPNNFTAHDEIQKKGIEAWYYFWNRVDKRLNAIQDDPDIISCLSFLNSVSYY